jgi:hypothetical protein
VNATYGKLWHKLVRRLEPDQDVKKAAPHQDSLRVSNRLAV